MVKTLYLSLVLLMELIVLNRP